MTSEARDRMAYMSIHAQEWLTSTSMRSMPLAAQGAFMRLLAYQFLNAPHGVPVDERQLRDMASACAADWRRWGDIILALFPIVAGEHDNAGDVPKTGMCNDQFHIPVSGTSHGILIRRNIRAHEEWCAAMQRRDRLRKSGVTGGLAKSRNAQLRAQQVDIIPSDARVSLEQNASKTPSETLPIIHYTTTDVVVLAKSSDATTTTTTTTTEHDGNRHSEVRRVLALLHDDAHRSIVIDYLDSRPAARRLAFVATLDAMASGLGGSRGKSSTWHQISVGTVECLAACSGDITPQMLRAFVAKAPPQPVAVIAAPIRVDDAHDDPRSISDANGHVVWHEGMPDHLRPDPRHD